MLFVHGLGGESLDWVDVAAELGDTFDCYALDLPGFADSPLPADGDLALDGHVRAIVEVAAQSGHPCIWSATPSGQPSRSGWPPSIPTSSGRSP